MTELNSQVMTDDGERKRLGVMTTDVEYQGLRIQEDQMGR